MVALVAKKLGMSAVFEDTGRRIPVTVLQVFPSQVMHCDNDRSVLQLMGGEEVDEKKLNKPMKGKIKSTGVAPRSDVYECYVAKSSEYEVKQVIDFSHLSEPKYVNVTGVTKGKGFAGTIKRHNFSGQRNTHGVSKAHRKPGSIGQCQDPGKVFKGKKMAGHMGNVKQQYDFFLRASSRQLPHFSMLDKSVDERVSTSKFAPFCSPRPQSPCVGLPVPPTE